MQELLDGKWGDEFAEGLAYCSQMEIVGGVEVVDNDVVDLSWKAENRAFGHFDGTSIGVSKGTEPGPEPDTELVRTQKTRSSQQKGGDA